MYARLVEVTLKTDMLDEAASLYDDAMVAARQTSGFIQGMLAVDRSTGRGYSITTWETAEDEQNSQQGLLQEQLVKFAAVFAGEPSTASFEVTSQS